ncbi:MAG: helicase-associated domain-containing protein [Cryobacterium sp.]|nr:helicase-associated domain-containing protein [Cryobacterium sp.]
MTSTATLASLLRASDDDWLAGVLGRRGIPASGTAASIRDYFDLADALLDPESLHACLHRLDRRTLAALSALGETRMPTSAVRDSLGLDAAEVQSLLGLALVEETTEGLAAWPEVTAQLDSWSERGLHTPDPRDAEPASDPVPASERDAADHLAAEHAFTAANATAEFLFELERNAVRLLARGTIGAPEKRRLAEAMSVDENVLDTLVGAAELAGLAVRDGQRLVASPATEAWVGQRTAERWAHLAEAWAASLPAGIRPVLAERADTLWGEELRAWLRWNYPGGGAWLTERMTAGLAEAERLGITAGDIVSSPGAAILGGDRSRAVALLDAALPTPVDRLYLQHDLSAVAPGPLEASVDARLRALADVDGRAIASRYRFTSTSVGRAVAAGESAESILEFLADISLSGVPQPLEYLVVETAARHGLLRVGPMPAGDPESVSYLRSDDATLLSTALVDRSLAVLGLRGTDSDRLVSRRDRSQVYWMLHDARYPVAAEDARGRIVELRRPESGSTRAASAGPPAVDPHRALVERLRIADAATVHDTGQAWFARQLDAAIRSKSMVIVSVRMPNGSVVDYRLEPASVAGGRLRARDPLSEIERTLPLSSIAAVSEA